MSLKEDIETAINAGESAREREPKAQEEFFEKWLTARMPILEKLQEAAEIFSARFGRKSAADRDNGAIFLNVNRDGKNYRLTLKADKVSKEIECSVNFPEGGNPKFRPVDSFTESATVQMLTDFAYAVAWAKPGSGGMVNLLGKV
ncbi:MAG TPA: hypothetical protein VGS07_17010 [Thermoanaerobaculia bacterium]|jgi:hypothetical protein|nr:hypothetical protein [Thermoanaerobaculia bacterium]